MNNNAFNVTNSIFTAHAPCTPGRYPEHVFIHVIDTLQDVAMQR
jgi:hypothetical protein